MPISVYKYEKEDVEMTIIIGEEYKAELKNRFR